MLRSKRSSAALSSEDRDKLDHLRAELDDLCSDLAAKFNVYDPKGKPRKAFIMDTLMKYSCIGCIVKTFTQQYKNRVEVDAIYKENHRLATSLLTQHLQYRLHEEGFIVQDEFEGVHGRIDVLIKPASYGVSLKFKTKEIIIEIKTGRSLSYDQIFRYLIDRPDATVIIWRVIMRQILIVTQETTIQLLFTYMENALRRGALVLSADETKPCSHNHVDERPYTIKNPQKVVDDFTLALSDVSRVGDAVLHVLLSNK